LLTDKKSFLQRGGKTAKVSAFVVAAVALMIGVTGLFAGSIVLLAQAVHSLTHVFALIVIYLGLKFAQRAPTEKFPYGYYRAETFALLIVAIFIVVSGVEILRESALQFLQPEAISHPYIALSIAAISIPFFYFLAKFNEKVGAEIGSQALAAEAEDFIYDVYSSIVVFIGVLSSLLSIPWIEASISVIIGLFILKTGIGFGRDAILTLMDAVAHPDQVAKMRQLAAEVQGVVGVHDLKGRKSGPFCFGEMRIEVEEGLSIERVHTITEEVERKLKAECKYLEALTIQAEPRKREKFRIAIPIEEDKGLESMAKPHFGSAPYFMLVDVDRGEIKTWATTPNPGAEQSKKRGISSANFLRKEKVGTLIVKELGEGPYHVLRDSFINIYELPDNITISEAVNAFLDGRLRRMAEPSSTEEIDG